MRCTVGRVEPGGGAEHVRLLHEHRGGEEQLVVDELGDGAGAGRPDVEHLRRRTARAAARTAATSASSPPAITVSSPESALTLPPETGASTKPTPARGAALVQRAGRRRASWSTGRRRRPADGSAASTPSVPITAASTSAGPGSDRNTQAAPVGGGGGRLAPASRPSTAAIAAGERSNTRTSWPAATRWRAIGAPIVPDPTKPITRRSTRASRRHGPTVGRHHGSHQLPSLPVIGA